MSAKCFVQQLPNVGALLAALLKARVCASAIYDVIDQVSGYVPFAYDTRTQAEPESASSHTVKGDIAFRSVGFAYPSRDVAVLKVQCVMRLVKGFHVQNVSWSVRAGEHVAFAGHSGCGKTTCVSSFSCLFQRLLAAIEP